MLASLLSCVVGHIFKCRQQTHSCGLNLWKLIIFEVLKWVLCHKLIFDQFCTIIEANLFLQMELQILASQISESFLNGMMVEFSKTLFFVQLVLYCVRIIVNQSIMKLAANLALFKTIALYHFLPFSFLLQT